MHTTLVDTKQTIDLSDKIFGQKFNESLVHQVMTAYLAGSRAGTHAQKTRAEVSGGGRKPWKQKGTGQARAGTSRSPLWRKGGIIFAAKPRDYSQKVNKKMYKGAIRSILSELIRENALSVIEALSIAQPKTKLMVEKLASYNLQKQLLIVVEEIDFNLYLAARNIPNIEIIDAASIEPISLMKYEHILMTAKAVKIIEEQLA